ncbi:MAG: hypothetical protein WCE21_05465 [Candidatus Babeliales bacterium]
MNLKKAISISSILTSICTQLCYGYTVTITNKTDGKKYVEFNEKIGTPAIGRLDFDKNETKAASLKSDLKKNGGIYVGANDGTGRFILVQGTENDKGDYTFSITEDAQSFHLLDKDGKDVPRIAPHQ